MLFFTHGALFIALGLGLRLLAIAMYVAKRASDPYSISVTCLPVVLVPVSLSAAWGSRALIHAFREMAMGGSGGMATVVTVLENVNRAYLLGFVASGIAILVLAAFPQLLCQAPPRRGLRSAFEPRSGWAPTPSVTPAKLPMTLEGAEALHADTGELGAISDRIAKTLVHRMLATAVLLGLSMAGFVTGVSLERRSAAPRSVGLLGLALARSPPRASADERIVTSLSRTSSPRGRHATSGD